MGKKYLITTTFLTPESYSSTGVPITSSVREVDLDAASDKAEEVQDLRDAMQTHADELTDVVGAMGVLNVKIRIDLISSAAAEAQ